MSTRTPNLQTRSQYQRNWGNYATSADLPNATGLPLAANEFSKLEAGDQAYSVGDAATYTCTAVGTVGGGDATWTAPAAAFDHFEASIIVGNIPEGDPATAQAAPFRYVGDPGDGSVLEAELLVAAISGDSLRIRLRPGEYALDPSAVTLPLVVPSNVILEGSGEEQTLFTCTTATDRHLFTVEGEIRDFQVALPSSALSGATGDTIIAFSELAVAQRVTARVGSATDSQNVDSLRAVFHVLGAGIRLYDVVADYGDWMANPASVPLVSCFRFGLVGSGPVISDVLVRGRTAGYASQVFFSPTAECTRVDLDVSGVAASFGALEGTSHRVRAQSYFEGGVGASAIASPVVVGCSESLLELELSGEMLRILVLNGSDNDVRIRGGDALGDGGEAVNIAGDRNTLRGNIRASDPLDFTINGNGNTIVALSMLNGSCIVNGTDNMVVGARFDVLTANGTSTESAHVTQTV